VHRSLHASELEPCRDVDPRNKLLPQRDRAPGALDALNSLRVRLVPPTDHLPTRYVQWWTIRALVWARGRWRAQRPAPTLPPVPTPAAAAVAVAVTLPMHDLDVGERRRAMVAAADEIDGELHVRVVAHLHDTDP
jgi:hypothetical protein